jgi:predicted MFS family arabinose efflux permease
LSCTVQVANHRKAIGLLYAGVQTAANAGLPEDQAGLAAALITASFQLGSALGLAVFSGIATSRTGPDDSPPAPGATPHLSPPFL